jgi:ribosome recycling factor
MNPSQLVEQAKTKLKSAVSRFQDDLKTLRTGRAHPSMLDGVTIEAYGTKMPLIQAGSITVPEPQLLQITPFDPTNLAAISAAIRDNQNLGLNPMDDGRVVRIQIPPLNEERRRDFVKILGGKVEDCMVSLRNARHDAQKELDQAKKDRDIGEDEWSRTLKQIDDAMNQAKTDVEIAAKAKEQEILTI